MSTNPITPASRRWNLGTSWQAALDGRDCQLCAWSDKIHATYPVEVSRLRVSRWLLAANQYVRGYSILVLDRHAIELHDLDPATRSAFMEDVADAARVLARQLHPIKMNIEMQGNVIPHLHCHLKPRYADDTPAHARIFQDAERRLASLEHLEKLAADMRATLSALQIL